MNISGGKYIGINQRVPFHVLDMGLMQYLQFGDVNREDLKQHMREFTKGENRVSKAATYAYAILTKPDILLSSYKRHIPYETYIRLNDGERKTLILCLFASTYPIAYDLLVSIASAFKVQSQVNKKFINQRLGTIYGSNRTLDIAIDALMPMSIELEMIKRAKLSIYEIRPPFSLNLPITSEAFIYTDIKLSGSKSIVIDDIHTRSWYMFRNVSYNQLLHNKILKFSEGRIGGGYISI
jgi:hypothetical protein